MLLLSLLWILLALFVSYFEQSETTVEKGKQKTLYIIVSCVLFIAACALLISDRNLRQSNIALQNGDIPSAQQHVRVSLLLDPVDPTYYGLQGSIYAIQRNDKKAKEAFQKAIQLSPFNSEYYFAIGSIFLQQKKYTDAKYWFLKAVTLNPYSNPKLYVSLSDAYLGLGDKKKAKEILRKAVYKAFTLNQSFISFKYLYATTGYIDDLTNLYIKLFLLDIQKGGDRKEATYLINSIQSTLNPQYPFIHFFKKIIDISKVT